MQRTRQIINRSTSSAAFYWTALVLFITLVILIGMATYKGVRNFVLTGSLLPVQGPVLQEGSAQSTRSPDSTDVFTPTLQAQAAGPIAKPWDGASRVTILLMGLDMRDWEQNAGAPRTDTMMLVTIDPLTHTAGMLNIPRDMWVNIPGFGYHRINVAYSLGILNNYPDGGGPGLAVKTVESFLGVPINYYAQIDFFAFEKFIDEIGGVDINVSNKITIDPIGKMNTVILQPGKHHLDGPKTLAYARVRHDAGDDFGRGDRQQQVMLAIRDKVLSLNMLPTLIAKAPQMYKDLSAGIHTNLTVDQAISLAWLAKDVDLKNIQRGVIGPPKQVILVTLDTEEGRQEVLKPVSGEIRLLRDQIFTSSGAVSPAMASADPKGLMQAEAARIMIQNGSGTAGMAGRTSEYLKSQGANVTGTGDGSLTYETSVIDYTGKPYTLKYLVEMMNIRPDRIRFQYKPDSQVDVQVTLGTDWAQKNPMH
jgi:polyisoprenyl-teichoic acid--peptidoglycan teichoic acid transferase